MHKEPTIVSIWKPEPRIHPITLSRNQPTQPGSKWTRSINWVMMKWWCIQPDKEDATQALDKDLSINSHAMVEKTSSLLILKILKSTLHHIKEYMGYIY